MIRGFRLVSALGIAALGLAACERADVRVSPSEISAFEGERTVVRVEVELGCDDPGDPVLELADGLPAAAGFRSEVRAEPRPRDGGGYYIGNPGSSGEISPGGPSGTPAPVDPATGRWVSICPDGWDAETRVYDVLIEPAALAAVGEHRLRVRAAGCGTEATAELTVNVLGALDLGPFCGITTGAACADDAGCERARCGELCAAAGTRERERLEGPLARGSCSGARLQCLASACGDPVPTGATCGCVQGACSWRPP